jgi:hypothetical protein
MKGNDFMKRLLCILLVMAVFMCTGVSVMAWELDFLTKEYKSMTADMEVSFELRKPIELLDYVNELGFDEYGDIKELVSSIFKSVITMNVSSVISDDYNRMQAAVKTNSDIPFKLNDDFGGNVYFNNLSWIDMDLNAEDQKYLTINKTPFSNKYIVYDLFKADKSMAEVLNSVLNQETMKKVQLETIKSIEENADININKNEITVTFDDAGAKKYLLDIFELLFSIEEYKNIFDDITGMEFDIVQGVAVAETFIQNIKIFDSIIINYVIDDGYISQENAQINIDLNIYDIMAVIGVSDEFITKENSDICFTVNLKCKYSDVNKVKEIKFPEISEENSLDMNDTYDYEYLPEVYDEDYVSPYIFFETPDYPDIKDNIVYFPFRGAVTAIDELCEITADNGIITAVINDKILKIQENTYAAEYDGESFNLENKLSEKNGILYVTDEFMFKVLGYKLTDIYTGIYDEIYTSYTFENMIE